MSTDETVDNAVLKSQSIRGGTAIGLGQGMRFALNFLLQVAMARLLDPAQYGLVAMIAPVLGFVQVFSDLGLLQAVVQKTHVTQQQLSSIFWITTAFSGGLTLVMSLIAPVLALVYRDDRITSPTIVLGLLIAVTGVAQLHRALLTRRLEFVKLALVDFLSIAFGGISGVIAAWFGLGYWALVVNQITNSTTSTVLCWIFARWVPSRPAIAEGVLPMLRFGGHVTGARVAGYLNTTIDNMMIGVVLGEVALGLYDRAWKLAVQPLNQLTAPVNGVAIPVLSRLQHSAERYRNAYVKMVQLLILLSAPGLLFAILMARPLVLTVFGAKWEDIIPVFSWVCFGALITPINMGLFWLFTSQGRTREQLTWTVVTSIVNVAAYAAGLHWGAAGVARTSAISVYLIQSPLLIWAATKNGPVGMRTLYQATIPFVLAIGIAAIAIVFSQTVLPERGFLTLGFGLALAYAVAVAVLACLPAGRQCLSGLWDMRREFIRR